MDDERVGHEYNNNILVVKFERLDNDPFCIEMRFEQTRRINCLFPVNGQDNWTSGIMFAKVVKNNDFYYWTVWKDFDPYNAEHMEFNDFFLIEARKIQWRILE